MVAFNMIVLHSGVSAASYTTEAPLAAPPVPRMLATTDYDYELNLKMKNIQYACHNNQCINPRPIPNKAAAMKLCDENPDCRAVVCVTPTKYGLRRWSETKTKSCKNCMTFEKPEILRNAQKLAPNKLLKTLPNVNGEYKVSFDALVRDHDKSEKWHNIIHLSTGENKVERGNRIPGVWLYRDGKLHVTSDVNGDLNYITDDPKEFPLNKWVSIEVESKKNNKGAHIYTVNVDGREIRRVENKKPALHENVKVYTSDPWYPAANGWIRDLKTTTTCPKKLRAGRQCENHCDCKNKCSSKKKMCC